MATAHACDTADRLQPAGLDAGLAYDAFGRTTTLPGYGGAGGSDPTSIGFYVHDLVRSETQGATTRTWRLDADGRLGMWTDTVSGVTIATKANHYDDGSEDSPDWIAENADASQWTANVSDLLGGLGLTVVQDGTVTYQYANLHGDITCTAGSVDATPTIGPDYDAYGNPSDQTARRYGWLGSKQRSGDSLAGLLLMGVRLYAPALGRFLTTDPVPGGFCNPYDYTCADPKGIRTDLARDETGQLTMLTAVNTADGSTWMTDQITGTTIHGQDTGDTGPAGTHAYTYDPLGRLTQADDAPVGATCTRRVYAFDADTNRTTSTAYPADTDGACQGDTGGVATTHTYDTADRLQPAGVDAGLAYDAFGRTTTLPGYGGTSGTDPTTIAYYADDLVRSQTQGTTTRTWGLDADGRFATWTDTVAGTTTATKTNHYDDTSEDSPDWIAENTDSTQWTANISDLLGSLGLTVDQAGTATYQYANIHGDITCTASAADTTPTIGPDYDEYGNPSDQTARRYGWLGGKQRSGDTLAGLILMGIRLYNPPSDASSPPTPSQADPATPTTTPAPTPPTPTTSTEMVAQGMAFCETPHFQGVAVVQAQRAKGMAVDEKGRRPRRPRRG